MQPGGHRFEPGILHFALSERIERSQARWGPLKPPARQTVFDRLRERTERGIGAPRVSERGGPGEESRGLRKIPRDDSPGVIEEGGVGLRILRSDLYQLNILQTVVFPTTHTQCA